jgi:hypothetical protein
MKRIQFCAVICIVAMCSFLFNQCALIFSGTKANVHFDATPVTCEVWVDGALMGNTPCKIELKKSQEHTIEFRKAGYATRTYKIQNSVGAGWVILDILGGLVPVIIDAATGAWYSFDQDNINTVLEKQQPRP